MNPNFLPPGYLLRQRYSIQHSLGQGGFGITYLAYDSELDQEVCIKELFVSGNSTRGTNLTVNSQTTGGFSFADFVQRFVQEARQLARFQHPNIVRVLDIFRENETAYTVMEYVRGENLKELIKRQGALTGHKALQLTDQLLDAVEEVHKKGMLHRDIKPENVLVTEEGRVVLIDFGSAREFSDGKTTTQTAMLTPGYAPIEQYSDRAQRGPYTDIYALGATIYFMLSGQKPIAATDRSIEELAAPHHLNSEISSQVSTAVMLAMEIKPERRFQHIAEMREALKSLKGDSEKEKVEEAVPPKNPDPVEKEKREGKQKSLDNMYILATIVILLAFGIFLNRIESKEALQTENTASAEVNTIENQPDSPTEERTKPEQVNQGTLDQAEQESQLEREKQATLDLQQEIEQKRELERKQKEERKKEESETEERQQQQQRSTSAIQNLQKDMVYVAGGTFTMGCNSGKSNGCFDGERPAHQVTVSSFNIGKYEVTQSQWYEVMGSYPSNFIGCFSCPVEQISWNNVQEFIRKLNQISGNRFRLPTEAEWEYAARGGSKSRGYTYSGSNNLNDVAWNNANSSSRTHPVGQKKPNELGIYDMSGNVYELCSDRYGVYRGNSQTDPTGASSGEKRVNRGGSWNYYSGNCRVSDRSSYPPESNSKDIGFRLVSSQ